MTALVYQGPGVKTLTHIKRCFSNPPALPCHSLCRGGNHTGIRGNASRKRQARDARGSQAQKKTRHLSGWRPHTSLRRTPVI